MQNILPCFATFLAVHFGPGPNGSEHEVHFGPGPGSVRHEEWEEPRELKSSPSMHFQPKIEEDNLLDVK